MSDDLERRLGEAFHRGSLPPAPPSLVEALRRVPDAPVAGRHARVGRSRFGLLVAAVVLVAARSRGGRCRLESTACTGHLDTRDAGAVARGLASAIAGLRLEFVAQTGRRRRHRPPPTWQPSSRSLKSRLASAGIVDPTVTIEGSDTVVVELPGVTESPIRSSMLLGHAGRSRSCRSGRHRSRRAMRSTSPRSRRCSPATRSHRPAVGTDQNGRPGDRLRPDRAGARSFGDYTAANVGSYFAITLDGVVLSAPVIQNEIRDGQVQITGGGRRGSDPIKPLPSSRSSDSVALPFPLRLTTSPVTVGPSPSGP